MLNKMLIGLFILALPAFASAADIDLRDVVTALETPFKPQTLKESRISDFSADFSQESHVTSINRVQRGAGSVRFRFIAATENEDGMAQFRWDYQEPDEQAIISDGSKMWVYLPDNKQVIVSDLSRIGAAQGENPVTFLSGLGNLSADFFIAWGEEQTDQEGNFQLQLTPRQPSQLIQKMMVVVSQGAVDDWLTLAQTGRKFPIKATIVTDQQGNRTAIRFDQIKVNNGLQVKEFSFIKPDDVELVKPEQMGF